MRLPVPPSPHDRALVVVALGVVLVFTAAFAPMGAITPTYRYEVVEVSPDSHWAGRLSYSDEVLTCRGDDPECQHVSRVRENGPEVVERQASNCAEMPGFCGFVYQVVYYPGDGQFYRPRHDLLDNESVELRLDPISNRTAMAIAALDARSFPPEFQRLFESGTVRTSDAVAGWKFWDRSDELVEYEGRFYRPGGYSYHGPNRDVDEILRALAALAGIGLLLYGRTMHHRAARE